jgi:phage tail protein X
MRLMIETLTIVAEHTTLDLLLWRRFRREVPGLVEDTLQRNPDLAKIGVFLPVGLTVDVLTPAPEPRGRTAVRLVSLYD